MTSAPEGAGGTGPGTALSADEALSLAKRHGLKRLGGRPPFGEYVRDLWRRRGFLWTLARAEAEQKNAQDRLGLLWTLLNPLLLVVSYFLIFGLLLKTREGVGNFIGFLSIGVVVFGFSAAAITRGSRAVIGNLNLVRALRFPRAVLPLSVTLTEGLMTLPAAAVLIFVMLVTGERPDWEWLLLPVALLLQTAIVAGLVFMGARLLNVSRDLGNLIPVVIRLMRYVSGVFFSIAHQVPNHVWIQQSLAKQPLALPITLVRESLMNEYAVDGKSWGIAAIWAVVLFFSGLWLFWRDEAKYGRG